MRAIVRSGAGSSRVVTVAVIAAILALAASAPALAQSNDRYPSPPQSVSGKAGNQQVAVTWNPGYDLGSPPTNMYRAIAFTRKGNDYTPISACGTTGVPPANLCTVMGLQNGTRYFVRVRAMNGTAGDGYTEDDISKPVGPYAPKAPNAGDDPETSDGQLSTAPDALASATGTPGNDAAAETATGASPSVSEHRDGQFSASLMVVDSWDSGDLIHAAVTNTGDEVREWRIQIPISGTICRVFNALGDPVEDGTVTLSNATWNGRLQQGASTSPGEEGVTLIVARAGYDC